jgi:hypothetical protein
MPGPIEDTRLLFTDTEPEEARWITRRMEEAGSRIRSRRRRMIGSGEGNVDGGWG